jgi:hypothetical protein
VDVSFKSRQKKRQIRIAVAQAKREHRDVMATRYYHTLVRRPCRCAARGCRLRAGDEMVYRHDSRLTLCVPCADADPVARDYRTSSKWERTRERQRKRGKPSSPRGNLGAVNAE